MELHQVRYFLAVCDARNFTRAAERCNVSQPALTSAIKKLEEELDGALFHRERSGAKLTTLGRLVFPRFQRLAGESEWIAKIAHDHRHLEAVPVRLGVMPSIGPARLTQLLEAFRVEAPGLEIEIEVAMPAKLTAKLEEADLDVVVTNVDAPPWAVVKPLYEERYYVVLPPDHPLSSKSEIGLPELGGERYIDRLECELRDQIAEVCAGRSIELYAAYRADREAWVECLVRAGIGYAFMPEHSIVSPDTVRRPLVDPEVRRSVSLMRSAERPVAPAAKVFWDTMLASSALPSAG